MLYDLTIIGAGPAGITASIYAARKKVSLLVIASEIGGQVINNLKVENYTGYQEISGPELVKRFKDHLDEFKFDFVEEEAGKVLKEDYFNIKTKNNGYKSKAVIIATGAKPKMLGISGEEEFRNRGVTYCATCDAPLFAGRDVAVIGGGNSALWAALQLTGYANRIYIINERSKLEADAKLIDRVTGSPLIEIFNDSRITAIEGEGFVHSIRFSHNGEDKKKSVQGVFINIGNTPAIDTVKGLVKVNLKGEIEVDIKNKTNIPGLFAAGDCTSYPYKQIIVAAGQGAAAALSAYEYLGSI